MPSASSEPMHHARLAAARCSGASGDGFKVEAIFQQNGVVPAQPLEFGGQQAERRDGGEIHAVFHGDQLGLAIDFKILRRVNFGDVQVLVHRLRAYIVLGADFRGDLVPGGAGDDDADELFAAAFELFVQCDLGRGAPLEMEGVKGEGGVGECAECGVLSQLGWNVSASKSVQTGISCGESSVSETRMVSPRPSHSSEPMPMADLMRPSSPSPASVTPRWMG